MEFFVKSLGIRRYAVKDFGFVHRPKQTIAAQAPLKGIE